MSVAFTIRPADLERFVEQVTSKKRPEGQGWIVYMTVKGRIGSFSAGGIIEDYPVMATAGRALPASGTVFNANGIR